MFPFDMSETGNDISPEGALSALAWLAAMGADEAIGEAPVNRIAAAPPPPPPPAEKPLLGPKMGPPPVKSPVLADRTADAEAAIADARRVAGECASLAEIAAALSAFEACPLSRTATNLVFTDGAETPELLVIGDFPGREDDGRGVPFSGPEGALLDRMLEAIGHSRATSLLTHLVFWRPPGGRPATDTEVLMCLPFLERLAVLAKPKAVLALGEAPAKRLLNATGGILRLRGQWGEWQGLPLLASWGPATLLKTPAFKADAWKDLKSLKARLDAAAAS